MFKLYSRLVINEDMNTITERKSAFSFDNIIPTWYNNLPVRALVHIFSYFDEDELRNCIIPVCQQWKYAALKPILWRKFIFHGKHVPTEFICKNIRDFIYLEELRLFDISDPVTVIRQVCRCRPCIKRLAIRRCPPIPETSLRYIIKTCKELEELDLSGTEFKSTIFYKELSGLNNLKKLNLSNNQYLSVKNLLTAVLNCRNLEDLRVSNILYMKEHLSDQDASLMVLNISENLISLSLDTSSLTSNAFQTIFNCSKLERLGLYGASNLPGELFVSMWLRFPNLTQLKIRQGHQISDSNVTDLFTTGREVMKNLILLDFAGCWKIGNSGLRAISECCRKLHTLSLKSCKSITNLSSVCDQCQDLTALNIAFLTQLNIKSIFPLPQKLQTLLIDDSAGYEILTKELQRDYKHIDIRVCESEFRKCVRRML